MLKPERLPKPCNRDPHGLCQALYQREVLVGRSEERASYF